MLNKLSMINLIIKNIVIILGLLMVISSCSTFKKSEVKIIKGNYEVIKLEKVNNNISSNLICIVYDKLTNDPISYAYIEVNELKIGGFTNDDGIIELNIPKGKYTITVMNGANTNIKTKHINFKPNTITKIIFRLGTVIIYCD
jgi:hypothetical protein